MNNKINEVIQSREITPRGAAAVASTAAGLLGVGMVAKHFLPRANDIIWETVNNNEGWLALGGVGLGAAAILASKKHEDGHRTVKVRGYERDLSKKAMTGLGLGLVALGIGFGIDWFAVSESPTQSSPRENSAINVDISSGDGDAPAEPQGFTPPGQCEIIADFNSEEAQQSDRYELDAVRLQSYLFDSGLFGPSASLEVAVDGNLGDKENPDNNTGDAVDRLQTNNNLDPSMIWNAETCAVITEFMDGNPATPAFNSRPEVRFTNS